MRYVGVEGYVNIMACSVNRFSGEMGIISFNPSFSLESDVQQNNQVVYRNDKIFYNGELWNLIDVEADGDKHVKFNLGHTVRDESTSIIVGTQDIKFFD